MFIYFFNGSHIVIWGLFWSVIFSQDKKKVDKGGGGEEGEEKVVKTFGFGLRIRKDDLCYEVFTE